MHHQIQQQLQKLSSKKKALGSARFFKTGPGEYSAHDRFLGASVPEVRQVVKHYADADFATLQKLLQSSWNEERLCGLLILNAQFKLAQTPGQQRKLVQFYLKHRAGVNNWNLVDSSAATILGKYYLGINDPQPLLKLLHSKRHWDRRIAIVATLSWTKAGQTDLIYKFSKLVFNDSEDLMHKATGWMLREAGKQDSQQLLFFIKKHAPQMPRTMLRYAIEKFPEKQRKALLQLK